ncbi:MAG: nucleotide pyrophosphohydrolase [Hyphomicrobiaceae bacterium]|nr:MAG: nucleotide pyrophosphohydrolase [Hyphomicrobiaceae bacterium]
MTPTNTYGQMVKKLFKPGEAILQAMSPKDMELNHAALGIAGETGELVDALKKYLMYLQPLDRENVVEELGDLEFYMEAIRQSVGITRHETLEHNYNKLMKKRYPNGYSDEAAIARADKVGE